MTQWIWVSFQNTLRVCLVGWVKKWDEQKMVRGGKCREIKETLVFPQGIWLGVEKWRDEKIFCLVKKKNKRIENRVCINLSSCLC